MAQRKREIKPITKKEQKELTLPCEWNDCQNVFEDMDSFQQHVTSHIASLDKENKYAKNGKLSSEAREEEDVFYCSWRQCGADDSFKSFLELIRHVYFHAHHTKLKSLAMTLIFKNSLSGCKLDSSTRNFVPEISDTLECGWAFCQASFDNPETLYKHVENHCDTYKKGNKPTGGCACQWEGCDFIAKSKHKLRDHMRTHTQEKQVACPTCGGFYSNTTKFFDHMKRQDVSNDQSYQCSHCNKRFSTERLLSEHMRHHVNNYKCPLCDLTLPCPSDLRNHLRYCHSNERPFQCPQCGYRGKSTTDLQSHMQVHVSDKLKCDVEGCSFKCKRVASLNQHIRKQHNKEVVHYLCHLCEAKYESGRTLTHHLKTAHNFKWPAGHKRFRYQKHDDGFFRLQMVRYESIELTEQLLKNNDDQAKIDKAAVINTEAPAAKDTADNREDFAYNLQMLGNVAAAIGYPDNQNKLVDIVMDTDDDSMTGVSVCGYTSDETSSSTVLEGRLSEDISKKRPNKRKVDANTSLASVDSCSTGIIPETPAHSPPHSSSKRHRKNVSPRKLKSKQEHLGYDTENKTAPPQWFSPSSVVTDISELEFSHSPASTGPNSPWPTSEASVPMTSGYPSDTDCSGIFSPDATRNQNDLGTTKELYLLDTSDNHRIVVTSDVPVGFMQGNQEFNHSNSKDTSEQRDIRAHMLSVVPSLDIPFPS